MTWALKRQIIIISVFLLIVAFFLALLIYPYFNKPATCTDGRQNGTETGVDCGGSCVRACIFEAETASLLWARAFPVVPGRYNAVAYLENHNKTLVVDKIKYEFRFSDKDNIFLGRREGIAHIPPGRNFAIFESGLEFGDFTPIYTTFKFTEAPIWTTVSQDKVNQIQILSSDIILDKETSSPHLQTTLQNKSLFTIPEVNTVAVLYDVDGNAVSASSTFLDELSAEGSATLNFTWPLPFTDRVVETEILPAFNILNVKLK